MKIRHRITLWITLAGILASLVFSLVIVFEMIDEPYELLDQELDANARALASNFPLLMTSSASEEPSQATFKTPYWVRITNNLQQIVFESELARGVKLPLEDTEEGYSVNTDIPLIQIIPDPEEEEDEGELATFRVRVFKYVFSGKEYQIQIARPIENINQEFVELFVMIEIGLAVSALFLILISYFFAGRILKPIQDINTIANEFTHKTLDKRIPLGENKDEIHELSSALNAMFERLQFSFERQKEFIANASHELRTPLTLLKLSQEEFFQNNQLPEPFREKLEMQSNTVLRMDRLVKKLLDLSALELAETLTVDEFVLNDLIESIVEDFRPYMANRNITFASQVDDNILVRADKERLKRIFINLFENAIKYNQENGEIRLHLQQGKQDRNVIVLMFNTGKGIPVEDHERVFEQFYRVEKSRSAAHGGFGLGLTIVKRIVELHGGTISLTSKPDNWTQLYMILPILANGDGL